MSLPSNEEWRPVPGYEGCYEVSDHGRVRSVDRTITRPTNGVASPVRGRLLSQYLDSKGRPAVHLYDGGKCKNRRVHQLVLLAFTGPGRAGMEVCHNDGDKLNNRLDNLRWDTRSENMRDLVRHGRHPKAKRTHCAVGHPLSGDNLYVYTRRNGRTERYCLACRRQRTGREVAA